MAARTEAKPSDVDLAVQFIMHVRDEPTWFARDVLNHKALPGEKTIAEDAEKSWELDTFQAELLEAMADIWRKKYGKPTRINHEGKPFITVRSGHGPGKTHTAALMALTFGTAFPARIICTAPKLAQLRTRVWGAIRKIHTRAESWWRSTLLINDTTVYWRDPDGKENRNWCILAETASNPENLAGHHERFIMVLVEEATGVTETLWPVIFGALSTGEIVILVIISNPTKITGTFAASHLQKREEKNWFRYHINLNNARRINRTWVAAMERKYGVDSPIVAVRCHGEFPTNDPNQLFAVEWIDNALNKDFHSDGSLPHFRITIDVADGGENESVLTVGQHFQSARRMRKQRAFNFPSSESPIRCADEGERAWKEYGCSSANGDFFIVDSLGVGAGTAGELMRRGYPVVTYKGGEASSAPTLYRNRRVQSYLVARNDLRDGLVSFDEDFLEESDGVHDLRAADEFMAQMCSIKTKNDVTGDRVEDLMTKKEMTDNGIASPDRADSFVMQYATQAPRMETGAQASRPAMTVNYSSALEGL